MQKQKGFTLVETVVTISIFILAMGAISALIIKGYQAQSYALQQAQAINEARKGIETMVKEIREARTAENGAYVIVETLDFEFIFYGDIDFDQEIERVRYFIEGSQFKKGVIEPTPLAQISDLPVQYLTDQEKVTVLSQYVQNLPPIFRYFDESGNELLAPARKKDTKIMQVYLVINIDPNRVPGDFTLVSEVQIRNLKTNL